MMLRLFIFCLLSGLALADNTTNFYNGQTISNGMTMGTSYFVSGGSSPAWSPTNIPGMAYFWNYKDVGFTNISVWTDEIQGVQFSADATANQPTNSVYGMRFGMAGTEWLTNSPGITMSTTNFSFWCVFSMHGFVPTSRTMQPILMNANADIGFGTYYVTPTWRIYMAEGAKFWADTGILTKSTPPLDVQHGVWANGSGYTNGVAALTTDKSTVPMANLKNMGNDGAGDYFSGMIQYIGIWTNTISQASVTALYDWANTNGWNNPTTGIAAWWKLDEGTGSAVADASGNGWSGYLTNYNNASYNPTWTNSEIGSGLQFGGNLHDPATATNFVVIPNSSLLTSNMTNMSISMWVKAPPGGAGGDWQTAIMTTCRKIAFTDGQYPGWGIVFDDAAISAGYSQSNAASASAISGQYISTVRDGLWHNFTIVKDSTGTNLLQYVDGVFNTGGYNSRDSVTNWWTTPRDIWMGWAGKIPSATSDAVYPGCIDDVRIYNRLLTQQEIANLVQWGFYIKTY